MRPPHRAAYPAELTEHSYRVLLALRELVPTAILIGGWGTWVRRQGLTSHDIDVIVTHADRDAIFAVADEHSESRHFGSPKWRAELDGHQQGNVHRGAIHVDLYVPHQSKLGQHLQLAVERLVPYAETVDGWRVLDVDAHAATKLAALLDRPESQPGEKDRIELFELMDDLDPGRLGDRLADASELPTDALLAAVHTGFDYLNDLGDVGRQVRRTIARFVGLATTSVRKWRDEDAGIAFAGVGMSGPPSVSSLSPGPGTTGGTCTVRCEWVTAEGRRCQMRLRPGSKCPHHPWTAPLR